MRRSHTRNRVASKSRLITPNVISLEARQLLTTTSGLSQIFHPMFEVGSMVTNPTPSPRALTPTQVRQAYGFNQIAFGSVLGDGTGQTIAIVDAYHDPNIQSDLNVFNAQFGLPNVTIKQVNQTGGTNYPAVDPSGSWTLETALDVEWAHAIAPGAQILLVEANSANGNDLLASVNYAAAHASVVSMSWGAGEFSGENYYDSYFSHSGVSFVASSGDNGAPISWPASSPNVLAIGGTTLALNSSGAYAYEIGWSGSGGGPSAYESRPTYQTGVVTQTTMRANPDVSYAASPNSGFAVYHSNTNGTGPGWLMVGGTSAGAPQWAALLAIANQGRDLGSRAALNSTSPQEIHTTLYQNAKTANFHDVTTGTSTGTPNFAASAGFDYVTGLGSPVANLVVQSFDGNVTQPGSNDHLTLAASTVQTAGQAFTLTVTAQTSAGATDTAYRGTIRFSSSDVQAGLPANYTFTTADAGTHTFSVTLKTAGSQSISTVDTVNSAVAATPKSITVNPAAASQFFLSGLSSSVTAGASQSLTVTARDPYGNLATGYLGTVRFSSSDAQATLPGAYTFTTSDGGVHTFGLNFQTAGSQSVAVTDGSVTVTQSGVSVAPAAPNSLVASVVSASQINLSWTSSTGNTGYLIERSPDGSTGWTQIATTANGVTTYQNTGLAASTTYYYRVKASGGGLTSSYTATAFATTSAATTTATVATLWSDSFTPTVSGTARGSYNLGLKFRADVAGTVVGVRFYKQSQMNGSTHVGYLWSSTGTLLASATFTNETASGWEQVNFSKPVSITANTVYIVSYSTGNGYYVATLNYFNNTGVDNGPLHAPSNGITGGNGVYGNGLTSFPSASYAGQNYWVDVAFSPSTTPNVTASLKSGSSGQSRDQLTPAITPNAVPAGPIAMWAGTSAANSIPAPAPRDVTVTAGWFISRRSIRPALAQVVTPLKTASAF